jgi:hypothetical protein
MQSATKITMTRGNNQLLWLAVLGVAWRDSATVIIRAIASAQYATPVRQNNSGNSRKTNAAQL